MKLHILFTVLLTIFLALSACKGPEGPAGPQGTEGPEGPVGPAGEDGSMIYAGENSPTDDIGSTGDYYLNSDTGEFYGPKDNDGWGDPIIVLMGEGGGRMHSGTGTPSTSIGTEGDYYLDKSVYELYGPKTGAGWGTPLDLKGADGSDNVTRYIFPGHDFTASGSTQNLIFSVENGEESVWLVYLVSDEWKYFVPGYGPSGNSEYREQHAVSSSGTFDSRINRQSGPGEVFDNIYIVRIEAGATEDHTKTVAAGNRNIIPEDLDVSDYEAVADYYGFN